MELGTPTVYEAVTRRMYGRTWSLRLRTTPIFNQRGNATLPWFIFGGGVLLSFFGAGFTWGSVVLRW